MKRRPTNLKATASMLLSLCTALPLIGLRLTGLLEQLELNLSDIYYKLAPSEAGDGRFLLIGMTEADIAGLKTNRLSDWQLYRLLSEVKEGEPAAVGVDIFRDHPVPPNHWELQELKEQGIDALSSQKPFGNPEFLSLFRDNPHFFAVGKQAGIEGDKDFDLIEPPPAPQEQIADVGVVLDGDGLQRRGLLYPITAEPAVPSLSWALAERYLKGKNAMIGGVRRFGEDHLKVNDTVFWKFRNYSGPYARADQGGYQLFIHWRKADFEVVSVSDVLEGRVEPSRFKGRIVIVGAYAPSLNDQFASPLNPEWFASPRKIYGIEAIAQVSSYMISAVLDGRPTLRTWREPWTSLAMMASSLFAGYLFVRVFPNRLNSGLLLILLADILLLAAFFPSLYFGYLQPVVPLVLCLTASALAHYMAISSLRRKDDYQRILLLNRKMEDMIERRQSYRLAYNSLSEVGERLLGPLQSLLLINGRWSGHEEEFNEFLGRLDLSQADLHAGRRYVSRLSLSMGKVKDCTHLVADQLSLHIPNLSHLNGRVSLTELSAALKDAIGSICDIYLEDRDFQVDLRELFTVKDSRIYKNYIQGYRIRNLLMRIVDQPLRECCFEGEGPPRIEIAARGEDALINLEISIHRPYTPNHLTVYFCEELLQHNNGRIEIVQSRSCTIWNIDLNL